MQDVSVRVTHHIDEGNEYHDAFVDVDADICLGPGKKKIGSIRGIVILRNRIPRRYFMSAMDAHSRDLQWLTVNLFEPVRGRTLLVSLQHEDSIDLGFLYVDFVRLDDAYKPLRAQAIAAFLGDAYFQKNQICGAAYILMPKEAMHEEEARALEELRRAPIAGAPSEEWDSKLERYTREDVNAFLQNGFFQHKAIASMDENVARILVSSPLRWKCRPLRTEAQANSIELLAPPPPQSQLQGENKLLFEYLMTACSDIIGMGGINTVSSLQRKELSTNIDAFVERGASLATVPALQIACATNSVHVASLLFSKDPQCLNTVDGGITSLMVAAHSAAVRITRKNGIAEIDMIRFLLQKGANRDVTNPKTDLTAYGLFCQTVKSNRFAMAAMTGRPLKKDNEVIKHPSMLEVEQLLMPNGGPTAGDLSGGVTPGLIQYHDADDDKRDYGDESEDDCQW